MTASPTILVFDSGLGGLTVHAELVKVMPDAHFIYAADDAAFPYGALSSDVLITRVVEVMDRLVESCRPDLVVIACNTASTVCLPALRSRFVLPFVGTVPAVKPAAALSKSRMISVLGTPGTVSREYTHDLVAEHAADCTVTLVGAENLAAYAEAFLRGEPVSDEAVRTEIMPCFQSRGEQRTDAVALACTHYPLLLDVFQRVAPWPVTFVDPAPAIALRAKNLLGSMVRDERLASGMPQRKAAGMALFTSGKVVEKYLVKTLETRGLTVASSQPITFEPVFS